MNGIPLTKGEHTQNVKDGKWMGAELSTKLKEVYRTESRTTRNNSKSEDSITQVQQHESVSIIQNYNECWLMYCYPHPQEACTS